jgi:hypothetical protein
MEIVSTQPVRDVAAPIRGKGGRPKNTSNLYSKQPSSIATRLKAAGVDWVVDLATAIQHDDEKRISMWLKLLPYLVVAHGHHKVKKFKGKASKAAMLALEAMEGK